jgi:hypothetical protein
VDKMPEYQPVVASIAVEKDRTHPSQQPLLTYVKRSTAVRSNKTILLS